ASGDQIYEDESWSDNKRLFIKLRKFEDLELTEEERDGILSRRMIATCLSYLEKSPEIYRYVLCKCVITSKDIKNISALEKYHHLQYLDLSNNKLTSLVHLSAMPYLQYLDVSKNCLKVLLDFKAPYNLSYVDYSHNELEEIPDLSDFWSITYLDLARNNIRQIKGLENLRYLTYLNISENLINKLENLNKMRLQTLLLHHNQIDGYEISDVDKGLHTLFHIRTLDLSHNRLTTLRFFQGSYNLENLNMCSNKIVNLLEIYYLWNLHFLTRVDMSNNPISTDNHYLNICIRCIKHLRYLDDVEITAEEVVEARAGQKSDPKLQARASRLELLLLQQINHPRIGAHIVPYDQPGPKVIILVGPLCSRKRDIATKFVSTNKRLILGVNHTTRPQIEGEIDGIDYNFVTNEEFVDLVRKGEFVSTSEYNGHCYGIAHSVLEKCVDSVIVLQSDINGAMTLRVMGISPKLVLAMPRDEETHLKWLKLTFVFERIPGMKESKIKKCPVCVRNFSRKGDNGIESLATSFADDTFEMNDESLESISTRVAARLSHVEQFEEAHSIYERSESPGSLASHKIDVEENKDRSLSMKSYTGILKSKPTTASAKESKTNSVSFHEIGSLGDKLGSKRVSFNWIPSMDKFDSERPQQSQKSISESCIVKNAPPALAATPILSVLSASKLDLVETGEQDTVYMTVDERFEQLQMDKLGDFFREVLKWRQNYLEMHWENPGLFRAMIFTDDEADCMKQLTDLLHSIMANFDDQPHFSIDNNTTFKAMLESKLKNLDLDDVFVRKFIDTSDLSSLTSSKGQTKKC
ncbi:hypothetical protein JTB14_035294, partial [Gonioctena quinquepunctata]